MIGMGSFKTIEGSRSILKRLIPTRRNFNLRIKKKPAFYLSGFLINYGRVRGLEPRHLGPKPSALPTALHLDIPAFISGKIYYTWFN